MMNPAVINALEDRSVDNSRFLEELARCREIVIPSSLADNLIGEPIPGTSYFRTLPGDPTKGMNGFTLNDSGKKIYKIEHQPTGSSIRYRKLNHIRWGECWEAIPD